MEGNLNLKTTLSVYWNWHSFD